MGLKGTITILGCGNSFGVPTASGNWGQCDPKEPKNKRRRCSALIEYNDKRIIVDTGPDFREQMLEHNIKQIDGIIYTHYHGDHTNGIEDLRSFFHAQNDTPITTLSNKETIENLTNRFFHCYNDTGQGLYKTILTPQIVKPEDFYTTYEFKGLPLTLFPQDHNTCETIGIRLGDTAYSVDLCNLDTKSISSLKGVHTWIVDAADGWTDSGIVHCNIQKIQELNQAIKAQRVILTSLKPKSDYNILKEQLNKKELHNFEPAYDNMKIEWGL